MRRASGSADADLIRRDSALPGLGTLLDPELFVDALRLELRTRLSHGEPPSPQVTYLRYKPGTNCLAAYRLELAGRAVDIYAKAYRPEAWDKLQKVRQRSSIPGPLGPGRIILPENAIAVSVFPNDAELKALPSLADTETRRQLLRQLLPDRPDLWAGALHRLRYKPERRYVAQLRAGDGAGSVLLKVYVEPAYRRARANAKALRSGGPLRLARPLGRSGRHHALAFEWLPGNLLGDAIADPRLELGSLVTVGAALAEFHAQEPGQWARRAREVEAADLLSVGRWLGFVYPHLAARVQRLAQRLTAHLLSEPPLDRPIHGDFYPQQVLLDGQTVAILDLDRAVRGDPATDLGLFIAHLECARLHRQLTPNRLEALRDALLEGYRMATGRTVPVRTQLYTAAGLLRLAPDPFRRRDPDWPDQTEAIVERAQVILDELPGRTYRMAGSRHLPDAQGDAGGEHTGQ